MLACVTNSKQIKLAVVTVVLEITELHVERVLKVLFLQPNFNNI